MKNATIALSCSLLFLLAPPLSAVTISQCVDEEGNTTYERTCPPGTTQVEEKKIRTGSGSSADTAQASRQAGAPPDVEITMYDVPDCDACLVLKGVLDEYQAPFTEKNINSSDDVKRELQKRVGGGSTLTIPTIIIGETVISGYKKNELMNALDQAGFSKPAPPAPEEEEGPSLEEKAFTEGEETASGPNAPATEGTLEVHEDEQGRQSLRPVQQ